MFIKNKYSTILAVMTDVDPKKLDDCTILANVRSHDTRRCRFIGLRSKGIIGYSAQTEEEFYDYINNKRLQDK